MSLKHWLENSMETHADRTALTHETGVLSYRELARRSELAARNLRARGVGAGDRVALKLGKSPDGVCVLVGLLRLGAAYVPIDPQLPEARQAELLRLCSPRLTVEDAGGLFAPAPGGPPLGDIAPDAAAYVLFTSGSTGAPRAVEISHSAAHAFASWAAGAVSLGAGDVLLSTAPLSFDLSTFDLFSGLGSGARVVLAPAGITTFPASVAGLLERESVSVWYAVPYAFTALAEHGELGTRDLKAFRALISAGDRFPLAAALAIRARTGCRLFNFYGPTETNVCTAFELPAGFPAGAAVPIGAPVAGDHCRIRLGDGTIADAGRGELLVGGPTLLSGYREGERLGRFPDQELFPTGDEVERADGGPFFFLGRLDDQIKRWGYRVHPAETEAALGRVAGIAAAAVVAVPDPAEGHSLYAFAVLSGGGAITEEDVLAELRRALPAPSLPRSVRFLEALPLVPNGKVDRARLRELALA